MAKRDQAPFEVQAIIQTLKLLLKQKGVTYRMLSARTDIPESTLKKFFIATDCSVQRLLEIAGAAGIGFFELMEAARTRKARHCVLSEAQEEFFASDPEASFVFLKLYNDGYSPRDFAAEYKFSEARLFQCLRRVEKAGLIDLLPGTRIRFRVEGDIKFREGGPLQTQYFPELCANFLEYSFAHRNRPDHRLELVMLPSRPETLRALAEKIEAAIKEFTSIAFMEKALTPRKQLVNGTLLLALAPDSILDQLARKHLKGPSCGNVAR